MKKIRGFREALDGQSVMIGEKRFSLMVITDTQAQHGTNTIRVDTLMVTPVGAGKFYLHINFNWEREVRQLLWFTKEHSACINLSTSEWVEFNTEFFRTKEKFLEKWLGDRIEYLWWSGFEF